MSQVPYQAGAYPGFRSMKRLGIFLLSPEWDTSPFIVGLLPALSSPVPIYTPGAKRGTVRLKCLAKNTTQCPRQGLELGPLDQETSASHR